MGYLVYLSVSQYVLDTCFGVIESSRYSYSQSPKTRSSGPGSKVPAATGTQERDYSALLAWRKMKLYTSPYFLA